MKKINRKIAKSSDVFVLYHVKPFNCPIIFFYSDNFIKITKHLNKKSNKDIKKWLFKNIEELPSASVRDDGCLSYVLDSGKPLILFIKKRKKRDWYLYDTMVHEITHLVQHLEQYFAVENEQEFRAWLTESIFKDLRKLI